MIKLPQQTIVNVFQVWTTWKEQCNNYFYTGIYMYMSINVQCTWKEKKKRKFQTSRSKAPPYFVYNSASLWFTCCFHFTFSSCSRDASAVNCKQGTKLKQQTKLMKLDTVYLNIKALQVSWDVIQLSHQFSLNSFEICKML